MIAIIAVLLVAHQIILAIIRRKFDPFDVRVLVDLVLAVMWVYAPLQDPRLHAAMESNVGFGSSVILGLLAFYVGMYLPALLGFKRKREPLPLVFPERLFQLAAILFIIGCCAIVFERVVGGGMSLREYALGNRLSEYRSELNDSDGAGFLDRFFVVTHPIMLLWLGTALCKRQWTKAVGIYLCVLVGLLFVAVVRLPIIITLVFILVLYYRRASLVMRAVVLPITAIVFVVLLFLLNTMRSEGVHGVTRENFSAGAATAQIRTNLGPLQGYELLWRLHEQHALHYEYGLAYGYLPLTAIPRFIWPRKPLVSFEPRWTMSLFGNQYAVSEEGWGVWTFTPWGEGLAQFGLPGVVINLFLYGLLVEVADSYFRRDRRFTLLWFYYAVLSATYLRSSFTALAWTIASMFVPVWAIGVIGRRRLLLRRRSASLSKIGQDA